MMYVLPILALITKSNPAILARIGCASRAWPINTVGILSFHLIIASCFLLKKGCIPFFFFFPCYYHCYNCSWKTKPFCFLLLSVWLLSLLRFMRSRMEKERKSEKKKGKKKIDGEIKLLRSR
jgi:membrane protein implicated in regulation of membrane protease activity